MEILEELKLIHIVATLMVGIISWYVSAWLTNRKLRDDVATQGERQTDMNRKIDDVRTTVTDRYDVLSGTVKTLSGTVKTLQADVGEIKVDVKRLLEQGAVQPDSHRFRIHDEPQAIVGTSEIGAYTSVTMLPRSR